MGSIEPVYELNGAAAFPHINGTSSGTERPNVNIREVPHTSPAPVRVIHIGAGASGLLTAYKARKLLKNYELVCYEK